MRGAHRLTLWVTAAGCLMPGPAHAQALADPTRPAAALLADDAVGGAASAPELQSVIISPTMRAAIINGQLVRLGGGFGSARVVRISESEVVLREGAEDHVLRLYPGVKKSAASESSRGRTAGSARRTIKNAGGDAGGAK